MPFEVLLEGTNGQPVKTTVEVGRLVDTGLYERDRHFIGMSVDKIDEVEVSLESLALTIDEPMEASQVTSSVRNALGANGKQATVVDWKSLNAPYLPHSHSSEGLPISFSDLSSFWRL